MQMQGTEVSTEELHDSDVDVVVSFEDGGRLRGQPALAVLNACKPVQPLVCENSGDSLKDEWECMLETLIQRIHTITSELQTGDSKVIVALSRSFISVSKETGFVTYRVTGVAGEFPVTVAQIAEAVLDLCVEAQLYT